MTDIISINDAPERRTRVTIHDDLTYQIREISDDTANGVGTMLYRIAGNAADLAEEAWKLGGAK